MKLGWPLAAGARECSDNSRPNSQNQNTCLFLLLFFFLPLWLLATEGRRQCGVLHNSAICIVCSSGWLAGLSGCCILVGWRVLLQARTHTEREPFLRRPSPSPMNGIEWRVAWRCAAR